MIWLIGSVHVVVCFVLIVVVLLQKGKGQDFASTFGGGGTQTSFGARSGATILHRATTVAAVLFMLTSLTLTILMSRPGQRSVLGEGSAPAESSAPALPMTPETGGPSEAGEPGAGEAAEDAVPDPDGGLAPAGESDAPED
jgi:preprotein translocase subunit SecG